MPTQKRDRKKQGHQARQAAMVAAQRRQRALIRAVAGGFLAIVLIAGVAVVISPADDGEDLAGSGPTTTVTTVAGAPTTTVAKKPVELTPLPPGESVTGETKCPNADGSSPRTTSFEKAPPPCVLVAKTYTAEMQTTKGLIVIDLDVKNATRTVNNFVVLARYHFYDGVAFHRIIPNFVIQGGDPQQTGLGNPGYKFEDELPKAGAYKVGSLAMANSGPNTNGSQFFIVSGQDGVTSLLPNFSLFGQVTQGLDVVKAIDAVGGPAPAGRPSEVVKITSVTIKEM